MTLTMADSITAANLPSGYSAYAGYTDGAWPSFAAISARFPSAHLLSVTVTSASPAASACDCENGDLSPAQAIAWAQVRLQNGEWRPVIYASASTMAASILPHLPMARSEVRLWSAHYGAGQHICGPSTCGQVPVDMDGTQWTDQAAGENGTQVDASVLADGFFTQPAPAPAPGPLLQEETMPQLRTGQGQRDAFSFGTTRPASIMFTADPGGDGSTQTQVRVALHGSVGGPAWMVYTVNLTPASPSHTLSIPADYDGVVFTRMDAGGAVGVSFS